jgi:hypothetical protein
MVSKKHLIIESYLKMNKDINSCIGKNIFPEFWDITDVLFYFQYNFLNPSDDVQAIDNILEICQIDIDDHLFGKVCDIIIDFLNLLRSL